VTSVQIFGVKNSPATRAAERFFKERGIPLHVVDLQRKPMATGEIRRFIERFGLRGLLDVEGKAYVDAGLKYLKVTDAEANPVGANDTRLTPPVVLKTTEPAG